MFGAERRCAFSARRQGGWGGGDARVLEHGAGVESGYWEPPCFYYDERGFAPWTPVKGRVSLGNPMLLRSGLVVIAEDGVQGEDVEGAFVDGADDLVPWDADAMDAEGVVAEGDLGELCEAGIETLQREHGGKDGVHAIVETIAVADEFVLFLVPECGAGGRGEDGE